MIYNTPDLSILMYKKCYSQKNLLFKKVFLSGWTQPLSLVHPVTVLYTRQAEIFNMYIPLLKDNGFCKHDFYSKMSLLQYT